MGLRHFLSLNDLSAAELKRIIDRAMVLKSDRQIRKLCDVMKGRVAVLVFEKNSTRTRISFECGITQLGGNAVFMGPTESHLSRGESIEDTAQVISRMADLVVMRTGAHERIENMANSALVPVINGLTDFNHPCQLLADLQTYIEYRGDIKGITAAWLGDGNNVCHSWMNAARILDFQLNIATPPGFRPNQSLSELCRSNVMITDDPFLAVKNAQVVITDTWASMGQENERLERNMAFKPYCVDSSLMQYAHKNALFMHCLPAYRGQEVTTEVIDGPQSVVFPEAENRLHAQKALMEFLLHVND
ncbi:MAG: ornithine carbamoyltransferase [Gammaproteobacteria bacterium]|nr:ornithine carbamoyltransferase [Gammaproteobacteria bacterium]MCY4218106.1 ornithine carbamoyltransferase [Gammaproteobacteria bacterium]MCY4274824.1 ornithine carbamoyltransferase [Gammaproteobacteria bacterium]